jgi:hypothetical protein
MKKKELTKIKELMKKKKKLMKKELMKKTTFTN